MLLGLVALGLLVSGHMWGAMLCLILAVMFADD